MMVESRMAVLRLDTPDIGIDLEHTFENEVALSGGVKKEGKYVGGFRLTAVETRVVFKHLEEMYALAKAAGSES